eukprot:736115-Rhodomonas_salina.1
MGRVASQRGSQAEKSAPTVSQPGAKSVRCTPKGFAQAAAVWVESHACGSRPTRQFRHVLEGESSTPQE